MFVTGKHIGSNKEAQNSLIADALSAHHIITATANNKDGYGEVTFLFDAGILIDYPGDIPSFFKNGVQIFPVEVENQVSSDCLIYQFEIPFVYTDILFSNIPQDAYIFTKGTNHEISNLSVENQILAPPLAKIQLVLPKGGKFTSYWDDGNCFSDYDPAVWNDDFEAFLTSLGTFIIDWGDGQVQTVSYNIGLTYAGFTHTYAPGTYTLEWRSEYIFVASGFTTQVIEATSLKILSLRNCQALSTLPNLNGSPTLQYLNLYGCSGLISPPDLTNLRSLQVLILDYCSKLTSLPNLTGLRSLKNLYLNSCTGLTSPPVLKGLTLLEQLNLSNCTGLSTLPSLTELTSLKFLYLDGCSGISAPPVLSGLTSLAYLELSDMPGLNLDDINAVLSFFGTYFPSIVRVGLHQQPAIYPSPTLKAAAQAANPQCDFSTN